MAKHIWTVLCSKAITDETSRTVSLIDVIEELSIQSDPPIIDTDWRALPYDAVLVSFLERSNPTAPERCQFKIEILSPNGQAHPQSMRTTIDLMAAKRARSYIKLGGLPIHGFGSHKFVVSIRATDDDPWIQVAELPLEFKRLDATVAASIESPQQPQPETTRSNPPKKKSPKKGAAR